jgi:hypothetical protein
MLVESQLSAHNIESDLIRAELYREVREGQHPQEGWVEREIQPDEALRPELTAYRHYRLEGCKWVVVVACSLDDMREQIAVGGKIYLPPVAWIRERIEYYRGIEQGVIA